MKLTSIIINSTVTSMRVVRGVSAASMALVVCSDDKIIFRGFHSSTVMSARKKTRSLINNNINNNNGNDIDDTTTHSSLNNTTTSSSSRLISDLTDTERRALQRFMQMEYGSAAAAAPTDPTDSLKSQQGDIADDDVASNPSYSQLLQKEKRALFVKHEEQHRVVDEEEEEDHTTMDIAVPKPVHTLLRKPQFTQPAPSSTSPSPIATFARFTRPSSLPSPSPSSSSVSSSAAAAALKKQRANEVETTVARLNTFESTTTTTTNTTSKTIIEQNMDIIKHSDGGGGRESKSRARNHAKEDKFDVEPEEDEIVTSNNTNTSSIKTFIKPTTTSTTTITASNNNTRTTTSTNSLDGIKSDKEQIEEEEVVLEVRKVGRTTATTSTAAADASSSWSEQQEKQEQEQQQLQQQRLAAKAEKQKARIKAQEMIAELYDTAQDVRQNLEKSSRHSSTSSSSSPSDAFDTADAAIESKSSSSSSAGFTNNQQESSASTYQNEARKNDVAAADSDWYVGSAFNAPEDLVVNVASARTQPNAQLPPQKQPEGDASLPSEATETSSSLSIPRWMQVAERAEARSRGLGEDDDVDSFGDETAVASSEQGQDADIGGGRGLLQIDHICKELDGARGRDIAVLDVRKKCDWTETLIVVTGRSKKQLFELVDSVRRMSKKFIRHDPSLPQVLTVEGADCDDWMTLDLGRFVIHAQTAQARARYDIEGLWNGIQENSDDNSMSSSSLGMDTDADHQEYFEEDEDFERGGGDVEKNKTKKRSSSARRSASASDLLMSDEEYAEWKEQQEDAKILKMVENAWKNRSTATVKTKQIESVDLLTEDEVMARINSNEVLRGRS